MKKSILPQVLFLCPPKQINETLERMVTIKKIVSVTMKQTIVIVLRLLCNTTSKWYFFLNRLRKV